MLLGIELKDYNLYFFPYLDYVFSVLEVFNEEIIDAGTLVTNPKSYIREFLKFLKKNKIVFSFYSFFASPLISTRASALTLELVSENHNNDIEKNKYFKNPEFYKYITAAASFGFRVNKNAPWMLIADLNSKPMREGHIIKRGNTENKVDGYLTQHLIPDLDYLFDNYYDSVIDMSFFLLKTVLFHGYYKFQDLMRFLVTPGKTTFTPEINFKKASTASIERAAPVSTTIDEYTFTDFIVKLPDCYFLRILENILKTEFKTKNNLKYRTFRKDFYALTEGYVDDLEFPLVFLEDFYNPTRIFDSKTQKPLWTIPKNGKNILTLSAGDDMIPSDKVKPPVGKIVTEFYTGF